MIKLTAAISKRSDWTVQEWLAHYKERHAPLTASVTNFTRHGRRYLQNYVYQAPDVPSFPEIGAERNCVTELWFDSVDKMRVAYSEPDYMKYLRTDELRFCAFENLIAGLAQESEIFIDPGIAKGDKTYAHFPREKIFVFRSRGSGLEPSVFHERWREQRAPLFGQFSAYRDLVRRYVQSAMVLEDVGLPGGVSHDLIDEFWFDTKEHAVRFWEAYRSDPTVAKQDAAHTDPAKTWILIAREHEVFGPLPE